MASSAPEAQPSAVLRDWDNREYTLKLALHVKQLSRVLDNFGENCSRSLPSSYLYSLYPFLAPAIPAPDQT